jgi:hypothetical protein
LNYVAGRTASRPSVLLRYARAAHALVRLANPLARIKKKDAARLMTQIAGGKRIVVMIDDLDRGDATVTPKLLMGLRDLFEAAELLGILEAPPGFEPGMELLQSSALPLGDGAGRN